MKWLATAFAVACACAWALWASPAAAQAARDPLIVPDEGGQGSRFQIVGQVGWTPGATVTLSFAFTTSTDPLGYGGPFSRERQVTVLRDGTWSFPINVNDELFATPLDGTPGYIVVRAQSLGRTAQNAFIFSPDGRRPAGAEVIARLGFGPPRVGDPALAATVALFVAGAGALLVASGAVRRTGAAA